MTTVLRNRALAFAAGVACGLFLWGFAFPAGYSAAVIIVLALSIVSFRQVREALAYVAFLTTVVLVAGAFTANPDLPPWVFASNVLAVGLILSAATVYRSRLIGQLREVRADLESQVEARTAELGREGEERRQAEQVAERASAAKSRFLSNMSHELRTPLNAIIGYGELMLEEIEDGEDPAALTPDLEHSTEAARGLLRIVDDILDLSRIERGVLNMDTEPVLVAPLAHEVLEALSPLIEDGVERTIEIAPDVAVSADRGRLKQILINLVSNAAAATASGCLTIRARRQAEAVEITVSDTGTGIPAEALPTLFERFTRVDESTTKETGGTGLGLALCRELCTQMGGSIRVESTVGEGTTFLVRLRAG